MSQLFDKIKVATSKRSTFDLSHNQVTTSDFGYIIPICYRDMLPNDDFTVTPKLFTRLSPMSVPTYGRITARVHHFFVPYRILYPKWDLFIAQDSSNHTVPPYFLAATLRTALQSDSQYYGSGTLPRGTFGRLMSNLGLNPNIFLTAGETGGISASERISAFPFLAYYRIWLDWFADSNIHDHPALVAAFNDAIQDGGSMATNTRFLYTKNACFKKDYFTTAKVSPQDGDPSRVAVDIAGSDLNPALYNGGGTSARSLQINPTSGNIFNQTSSVGATSKIGQFTVEALRAANSLQRYMERNNFVGSKLINRLLVHFGVSPTPERLDMAEFLGGSSFDIQIGDVTRTSGASTSGTTATAGVGFQAGKGVGGRVCDSVSYHAKEHGVFMSLLSIIPDTGYCQGIPRFFSKGVYGDPLDYFTPEFENLGYQEILNKELFGSDIATVSDYPGFDPDGIFGYTPRYSEYKFQNDVLAGDFIGYNQGYSTQGAMEDCFHLFRNLQFETDHPLALNENFVECDNHSNDYDRIFQYRNADFDHFYFNINMDVKATRPMSGFGEPSLDATNTGEGNSMNLPYGGTRL